MTSLEERVAVDARVWGHFQDGKLLSVTTRREAAEAWKRAFGDEVQPLVPVSAAIAVCAEEMAKVAEHAAPAFQDMEYAPLQEQARSIAAAIRSMGERGE